MRPNPIRTSRSSLEDLMGNFSFYATGVRRTEMTSLDVGDYDPGTLTLSVHKGKGGKSRTRPQGPETSSMN